MTENDITTNNRNPTPTVEAIGKLGFEGHIIPHTWYEHITYTTEGGTVKVDLQAIIILSDIIYWYRPKLIIDEQTNRVIGWERKFAADKLQRNYKQISDHFGISKTQAKRAVHRLTDLGLITMEFRTVKMSQMTLNNVLYLEPVIDAIQAISYPKNDDTFQADSSIPSKQICQEGINENVQTNTEITTQNTNTDFTRSPTATEPEPSLVPEIPSTFQRWAAALKDANNKPAALRWMAVTLYGEDQIPANNYGMIGTALKRYDLQYLAALLWQNAARPPHGDPFKYILGAAKRANNGRNNGSDAAGWDAVRAELGLREEAI